MQIHGLHHVTAVTAQAGRNLHFYTQVLGLRLVKKTVNQDDVSAYHLFYADKLGSPGTDMTFFDWPQAGVRQGETDGILRTLFRVSSVEALQFWAERFTKLEVSHGEILAMGAHQVLLFEDFEGQRLGLVCDDADFSGEVWEVDDIPVEHALHGFFGVQLAVPELLMLHTIFTKVLEFVPAESFQLEGEKVHVYTVGGNQVQVIERQGRPLRAFAGGVHHVAFRIDNPAALAEWEQFLAQVRLGSSGLVERFYFTSLYFRVSDGILFELATDGPGFAADESAEHLGEALSLPPFLEHRRAEIEAGLKPLE